MQKLDTHAPEVTTSLEATGSDVVAVSVTLKVTGSYVVWVTFDGDAVGTELSASAVPGPVDLSTSSVLPGWNSGLSTVDIVAVVDLRDEFGNIVTAATAVTMASASTAFGAVTGVRPDASADPGRYTLTHRFAATTAADDVRITIGGSEMATTYTVTIAQGVGDVTAAGSTIAVPDAGAGIAGSETSFLIEARDGAGILATGADCASDLSQDECVAFTKADGSSPKCAYVGGSCTSIPCAGGTACAFVATVAVVTDGNGNAATATATVGDPVGGVYPVAFAAEIAGDYTVTVTLGGAQVGDAVDRTVVPAAPSAALSVVTGTDAAITARDIFVVRDFIVVPLCW